MSETNRQFKLASRPQGMVSSDNFERTESSIPSPGNGEILVRVRYISLDPAMRGWMNEGKSYVPPVGIGEVMRAIGVADVVESKHDEFAEGDTVVGIFGVQDYAVSDGKGVNKVDPNLAPLPRYLGTLGMPGMTAYFGLMDIGKPEAGQTVVVSGATGAVGQVVGQVAKIQGCRVVGIAGGDKKCAFAVDKLGYDACIDYKAGTVAEDLKKHCPDGVDIYFDNVGGDILDAVLTRLAMHARIVICGAISQYNNTKAVRGPANYMSLLVNRASMTGMVVFDYVKRYGEAAQTMGGWLAEGKMIATEDVDEGFDNFSTTFLKLFTGDNFGKLVLKID